MYQCRAKTRVGKIRQECTPEFFGSCTESRVRGNSLKSIPRYSHEEWLKSIRQHHNKIRRIIYPLLDSGLRARSEEFWRALLADFANASFSPILIHGDLGTENILIEPASAKLTGILDWGYAQVSDPALEFA